MSDKKDKIIELLKTECGLKGQLINMLLDIDEVNCALGESGLNTVFEEYIKEIDYINKSVLELEQEPDTLNPISNKN